MMVYIFTFKLPLMRGAKYLGIFIFMWAFTKSADCFVKYMGLVI